MMTELERRVRMILVNRYNSEAALEYDVEVAREVVRLITEKIEADTDNLPADCRCGNVDLDKVRKIIRGHCT